MNVTMVGAGYVGLVSGACFADFGHHVVCVDRDASRIEALARGEIPIFEPGLEELVARNVREGRLAFSLDPAPSVATADAVFIAVGTPSRRGDGHADLSYVYAAAEEIACALRKRTVIVTKSTVPVGTGDEVERIIRRANPQANFSVASNPEFLREGAAIADFKRPDRVIVGADDESAAKVMREIYRPLFLNETPVLVTDRRTAELIKYASNAFLAMKIAFINEMADLCEKMGADVQKVAAGIGLDRRIGPKFLNAGPGYGGSCFPKDTLALVHTAAAAGAPTALVETVVRINEERKSDMARRIIDACGGNVTGKTIAILGLSFKPNTDDVRDAPSLAIIPALQANGATITSYDPAAMKEARKHLSAVTYCDGVYSAIKGADAVVIVTEWDQFRALDLDRMKETMAGRVVVDLRNIYSPDDMRTRGFHYVSIGRG